MSDLLPCPFCGCAPALSEFATDDDGGTRWVVACDCRDAPEDQPHAERYINAFGHDREAAVVAWNRRSPPVDPDASVAVATATCAGKEELDDPRDHAPMAGFALDEATLAKLINNTLRSFELNGGNILDALATYNNEPTVKEALETVGDWSVWLAAEILRSSAEQVPGDSTRDTPLSLAEAEVARLTKERDERAALLHEYCTQSATDWRAEHDRAEAAEAKASTAEAEVERLTRERDEALAQLDAIRPVYTEPGGRVSTQERRERLKAATSWLAKSGLTNEFDGKGLHIGRPGEFAMDLIAQELDLKDAEASLARAVEVLEAINRRASPNPGRTLGDCADELVWITDLARAGLASLPKEKTHEG